jgi:hypothetical protein
VQEDGGWLGEVSPEVFKIAITTPQPGYVSQDYYFHVIGSGQLQVLEGTTFQYEGMFFKNGIPQSGTKHWTSSNTAVATIDGNGLLTAIDSGQTIIHFWIDEMVKKDSMIVEVVELKNVLIQVQTGPEPVNNDTLQLVIGEYNYIYAEAEDNRPAPRKRFAYETYAYHSSDTNIVSVEEGLVHALNIGQSMIRVSSNHNPSLMDSILVIVNEIPPVIPVKDTINLTIDKRQGTYKSTDLFTAGKDALVLLKATEKTGNLVNIEVKGDNTIEYYLTPGVYGYEKVKFIVEIYGFEKEVYVIFNGVKPDYMKHILFVNGGEFMNPNAPTELKTYKPDSKTTTTLDDYIAGATSVQDMVVDGNYAFVSADYYITRYDVETGEATDSVYTQDTSTVMADGQGTEGAGVNHKLAVYENMLLSTRQFSSAAPEDGYNVRIYNKGDLSLIKKISVSDQATDVVVHNDTAFVMINGGFAGTTSSLAVIDLKTLTLNREIDLGEDGLGVMQMQVKDNKIYCIRLADFMARYGSGIVVYDIATGNVAKYDYTAGIPYDSSPLSVEPATGDTIFVKKDLGYVAFNTTNNTFGPDKFFEIPSRYTQDLDHIGKGSVYDPEDERYYVAYAYWHGTGVGQIYDAEFDSVGYFDGVGASPEVIKVANVYENNHKPTVSSTDLTYYVGETEAFEIQIPENLFSDVEDVYPAVYLHNPAQYDWISFDRQSGKLSGNYNTQLSDTIIRKIVLQSIDVQGDYVTNTVILNICSFDDAPQAIGSIATISDYEYAGDSIIELSGLFADIDSSEAFTYQVIVNSDSSVAIASVNGSLLSIDYIAPGQTNITVQVTSSGKTASISFVVGVYPDINVPYAATDYEDLILADDSYWNGSDASGGFESGLAKFGNNYSGGFWEGWAYSNTSDVTTAGSANQYSAITGAGFDTLVSSGKNYGVGFVSTDWMSAQSIPLPMAFNDNAAHGVKGFYVTNSTYATLSMEQGDAFAKKFGGESGNDPDFFKLSVWGKNKGIETDTIEFYLADFRFEDNTKDYIIQTWQWIELSSLGKVDTLLFDFSSSDVGMYGINTPMYFNTDNFYIVPDTAPSVINPIADVTVMENAADSVISLVNVFADADDDDAAIIKSVKSNSNSAIVTTSIMGNNLTLSFITDSTGTAEIVVEGESNGKAVTDTFTVTITPLTGIENTLLADFVVYPNPTNGIFRIKTETNEVCSIIIFNIAGTMVYANEQYSSNNEIDISSQPSGQYIITVVSGGASKTTSIIKK